MKSWIAIVYLVSTISAGSFYTYRLMTGWVQGTPEQRMIPPEIGSNPANIRGFNFWSQGGYKGGK